MPRPLTTIITISIAIASCTPTATTPVPLMITATIAPTSTINPTATVFATRTNIPAPSLVPTETPISPDSLRFAAQARGIYIGAAVAPRPLRTESLYSQTLSNEFNILTPENAMKFDAIHPARDRYSFTDADAIVNFAIANGMAVRGHTLVWHNALPNWLTDGNFTRDELETILRDHIMTVVGHFRGRVFAWDVINEALGDDGSIRNTFWVKGIGNDIIDLAFRWAHEADPQARLFYNERTLVWLGPKPEGVYNFVQGLQKRNIPIDGIGLQLHIDLDVPPPTSNVLANMNRLSTLGLEIHLTETDVRMILPAVPSSLDRQSLVYQEMLSACLSIQNCKAFVLWGFTDKYSAIPREYSGRGAALIFDEMYKPKPAYTALNKLLNRH